MRSTYLWVNDESWVKVLSLGRFVMWKRKIPREAEERKAQSALFAQEKRLHFSWALHNPVICGLWASLTVLLQSKPHITGHCSYERTKEASVRLAGWICLAVSTHSTLLFLPSSPQPLFLPFLGSWYRSVVAAMPSLTHPLWLESTWKWSCLLVYSSQRPVLSSDYSNVALFC